MSNISPSTLNASTSLQGVYLILDEQWAHKCPLVEVLEIAAHLGVKIFQHRCTGMPMALAFQRATLLAQAAARCGATFLVNDRADLAVAVNADGVHLGQEDLPVDLTRIIVGPDKVIGLSTHNLAQVREGSSLPVDYLGIGPVFPSNTKKDHAKPIGLDGVRQLRALTTLPLFAIGGITSTCVKDLRNAGVDGVAVASAILDAENLEVAIKGFVSQVSGGDQLTE